MIVLARFLVPFLAPFTLGLFCVIVAYCCLWVRRYKTAQAALILGLVIFLFFGYGLLTRERLHQLERQSPPLELPNIPAALRSQIQYVVVLGNAHVSDPGIPATGQISASSMFRLIEGIRIQRQLPGSTLVISGGINQDPRPNAEVVSRVAELIGVDPVRIIREDRPRDTFEEAEILRPLLGGAPFILVTSAAHMVRALQLFRDAGMQPIAAPTDFILKSNGNLSAEHLLPSCGNLELSKRVIYEWLGELWGYLKQKSA